MARPRHSGLFAIRRDDHSGDWLDPDEVVAHALYTGYVLGEDVQRRALALVGDRSVDVHKAIFHLDVGRETRSPRLCRDSVEDTLPDGVVTDGASRFFDQRLHERAHQVGAADDADKLAVIDNRHALDPPLTHQLND